MCRAPVTKIMMCPCAACLFDLITVISQDGKAECVISPSADIPHRIPCGSTRTANRKPTWLLPAPLATVTPHLFKPPSSNPASTAHTISPNFPNSTAGKIPQSSSATPHPCDGGRNRNRRDGGDGVVPEGAARARQPGAGRGPPLRGRRRLRAAVPGVRARPALPPPGPRRVLPGLRARRGRPHPIPPREPQRPRRSSPPPRFPPPPPPSPRRRCRHCLRGPQGRKHPFIFFFFFFTLPDVGYTMTRSWVHFAFRSLEFSGTSASCASSPIPSRTRWPAIRKSRCGC